MKKQYYLRNPIETGRETGPRNIFMMEMLFFLPGHNFSATRKSRRSYKKILRIIIVFPMLFRMTETAHEY